MVTSRLDATALPVLIAEAAAGRVLGFARDVKVARELASVWAEAHGQRVLGLVCSSRFAIDPTTNTEATWLRARHARRAWVALCDELRP
jgi:hypothetical protein